MSSRRWGTRPGRRRTTTRRIGRRAPRAEGAWSGRPLKLDGCRFGLDFVELDGYLYFKATNGQYNQEEIEF